MSDPTGTSAENALQRLPCSVSQRMDYFYKTEWSEDLDWDQVAVLAEYVVAYGAPKGSMIFQQGGAGRYMCMLVGGEVDITMTDSSGAQKTLATIKTGKPFGEMSLVDGEPRSATAVAKVDSKVLILTQDDFRTLSGDNPELGSLLLTKLAESMSHRLRQTSGLLVEYLED